MHIEYRNPAGFSKIVASSSTWFRVVYMIKTVCIVVIQIGDIDFGFFVN